MPTKPGDYAERNEFETSVRRDLLAQAMGVLNDRERDILSAQRRLHRSARDLGGAVRNLYSRQPRAGPPD